MRVLSVHTTTADNSLIIKDSYKLRAWRMGEKVDMELIDKELDVSKSLELDGRILQEEMKIYNIGTPAKILIELIEKGENYIFKEPIIIIPRYFDENKELSQMKIEEYKKIKELIFNKIPLKSILPEGSNKGYIGINNMGNSCYINGGIQCLSNCPELTKYILLSLYKEEINENNPLSQNGQLVNAYADLITSLWLKTDIPITAQVLKKRIALINDQFATTTQQDSQEFILNLLHGFHEDLNRVKIKPYVEYNISEDNRMKNSVLNNGMFIYQEISQ